jgi:NTP pyrophosphatase (non-canonical NTP hydrolase)
MEKQTLEIFEKIRNWAQDKGIYDKGDPKTQYIKLMEEAGELAKAILKTDDEEFVDAIGDCVVVLTNLAKLKGYNIEDCINSAYEVIAKRKGKMENGTFVKEA